MVRRGPACGGADDGGRVGAAALSCAAGFCPTDAEVAGDQLFVLERRLSLLGGWQARIVAVPLAELPGDADAVIAGHELGTVAGSELGENYEAIDAWVDPAGGYRLISRVRRQFQRSATHPAA